MSFRSGFGVLGLSAGRHPAAHVLSVGHPLLLHADDAGPGQSGGAHGAHIFFSPMTKWGLIWCWVAFVKAECWNQDKPTACYYIKKKHNMKTILICSATICFCTHPTAWCEINTDTAAAAHLCFLQCCSSARWRASSPPSWTSIPCSWGSGRRSSSSSSASFPSSSASPTSHRCGQWLHVFGWQRSNFLRLQPPECVCLRSVSVSFISPRGVCMCSSSSTTTQPAGCASSSSSSLKQCPYPGFMVGDQFVLAKTVNPENK